MHRVILQSHIIHHPYQKARMMHKIFYNQKSKEPPAGAIALAGGSLSISHCLAYLLMSSNWKWMVSIACSNASAVSKEVKQGMLFSTASRRIRNPSVSLVLPSRHRIDDQVMRPSRMASRMSLLFSLIFSITSTLIPSASKALPVPVVATMW